MQTNRANFFFWQLSFVHAHWCISHCSLSYCMLVLISGRWQKTKPWHCAFRNRDASVALCSVRGKCEKARISYGMGIMTRRSMSNYSLAARTTVWRHMLQTRCTTYIIANYRDFTNNPNGYGSAKKNLRMPMSFSAKLCARMDQGKKKTSLVVGPMCLRVGKWRCFRDPRKALLSLFENVGVAWLCLCGTSPSTQFRF